MFLRKFFVVSRFFCIFTPSTNQFLSLCQFRKYPADIAGDKPGKFIRLKHKPKRKAGRFTPPATGKSQHKTKRNRELRFFAVIPYLCDVSLPNSPSVILTAVPGSPPGRFFIGLAYTHTRTVPWQTNGTTP